jgi:hypothetical protein
MDYSLASQILSVIPVKTGIHFHVIVSAARQSQNCNCKSKIINHKWKSCLLLEFFSPDLEAIGERLYRQLQVPHQHAFGDTPWP